MAELLERANSTYYSSFKAIIHSVAAGRFCKNLHIYNIHRSIVFALLLWKLDGINK